MFRATASLIEDHLFLLFQLQFYRTNFVNVEIDPLL